VSEPPPIKRRHVAAAVAGNALEFYDFTTYGLFSVAIGHAFFPTGPGGLSGTDYGSLMLSLGTFGAGFLLRPLGGIVLGRYADRAGRRPAMLVSFTLMGFAILALALIPSYSSIGLAAPLLAIAARLAQGFALGGEVGPTTAYLVEAAPTGLRGLYASWQSASQSLASMTGGIVGVALASALPPDQLAIYGWRIAFILGALTLPFGLYIRASLPETLHNEDHLPHYDAETAGIGRIVRDHAKPIILGLMILTSGTIGTYVLNYMTVFAGQHLHMAAKPSFAATLVNGLFGLMASLAGGYLSDRSGRRIVMIAPRIVYLLAILPVFLLIVNQRSTLALLGGTAVLSVLLNVSTGAFYVGFSEMLPRRVRGLIFATVYASAIAVFGGTTQIVVEWLIHVTGNPLAMAWYMLGATALGLVAMLLMDETAPVKLAKAPA
jgi:MFS transporter, MHS family, citrate/tricarballylate:H+ symporter